MNEKISKEENFDALFLELLGAIAATTIPMLMSICKIFNSELDTFKKVMIEELGNVGDKLYHLFDIVTSSIFIASHEIPAIFIQAFWIILYSGLLILVIIVFIKWIISIYKLIINYKHE